MEDITDIMFIRILEHISTKIYNDFNVIKSECKENNVNVYKTTEYYPENIYNTISIYCSEVDDYDKILTKVISVCNIILEKEGVNIIKKGEDEEKIQNPMDADVEDFLTKKTISGKDAILYIVYNKIDFDDFCKNIGKYDEKEYIITCKYLRLLYRLIFLSRNKI